MIATAILLAASLALSGPADQPSPVPTASAPATPGPERALAGSGTGASRPSYQYLPDEENWKSVCAPALHTSDAFDPLKCLPLGADPNRYLTLGADVRFKYEHFFDKDWNESNNGYLLERELLSADVHDDRLRAFVQLEHATATDPHAPVDPTWRDDLATTSAYAEYAIGGSTGSTSAPLTLRAGRQLLAYGSERMIDDRSGLNTEQPFDGVRARVQLGTWRTDVFAVRPVDVGPYASDDLADRTRSFDGIYSRDRMGSSVLDLYGLVDRRGSQFYYRGTGPEVRDTLGIRYATTSSHFDTDTEIDEQFGSFAAARIGAYAIETNAGYSFGASRNHFRIGVGGGIASGDHDPANPRFSLFRAPYPTGLTFGIIEANGNENTSGFTPNASYTYDRKVTIAVKDYFFYRQSAADGVYSAPGFPLRAPSGSDAAALGNLGYASVVDAIDRHLSVYTAYARYLDGAFLRAAPEAKGVPSVSTAYYNLWFDYRI